MIKKSEYPSRHFRLFALMWLVVLIALLFLSGCNFGSKGSGSGSGASGDTVIASIKIKPGGLMFTRRGESKKLSATAYNAAGEELNITDFTWTTSKPSSVSIDSNGQATSQTDLGSAMITARAGDISSTPMLVNIALPVPGAILIDDTQVVGDIRPHNINEPLTLGSVYDVTLTGMTRPEVADILISTGSAPVAGRVVEVRETNGQYIVTLKLVDLDELFTAISINETLPMPESDIEINPALETTYNISQKPGGMLVFAPKPGVITASSNLVASGQAHTIKQAATGTRRIISVGPFACNFDGSNVFPLRLTAAPAFTVTSNLGFDLIMDGIYMRRAVITGTLTLENTDSWMLNSDLIGKLTCEIEIGVLPVPVSGWVSLFVGGFVPFGLGMELSGEISLTQLGFEMKSKTGGDVEFGFEIPENGDFHIVRNYTQTDNTFETRWITPNSSIASSLRLKPSLAAYGYANLDIGFRRPRYANWKVVASKLGLKLGADLALVDGQIEDINYASDYKLSLEYNIGPGSDITDYLNRLGLNLGSAGITLSTPLFESPKALSITADVDTFFENDFINFTVKLDQETIEDIFAYNVSSVQIYHREIDASGNIIGRYIGQKTARNGQTEFNIRWLADYDGEVNDEFYAYVVSRFLPFPFFDSLELGVVEPIVTGKIVFINDPDFMGSQLPYLRNMGIYTMNADGSELTKLVDGDSPAWSPDGSKIAFISGNAIWVMDADGSNWIKLVDGDNASPPRRGLAPCLVTRWIKNCVFF